MRALREIAYNVLKGKLPLTSKQFARLKTHKKCVRLVANKTPLIRQGLKSLRKAVL